MDIINMAELFSLTGLLPSTFRCGTARQFDFIK